LIVESEFEQKDNESDDCMSNSCVESASATAKVRSFRQEWQTIYEWLIFDEEKNGMFCAVCRKMPHQQNKPFCDIPSFNFRKDGLTAHHTSRDHKANCNASSSKTINEMVANQLPSVDYAFQSAFRILFFQAKKLVLNLLRFA
jgi:hypothetical protein